MYTISEYAFVIIIQTIASFPYNPPKLLIPTDNGLYPNISGTQIYSDRHRRSLFTSFGLESTYQALNGIMCYVCPPGFYKKSDCVVTRTIAVCEPCPRGQYNSQYNIANKCAVCSTYCVDKNGDIERACNATSDITCRCKDGHFNHSKGANEWICIPHNKCQPGTEVIVPGSPERDTVCRTCADGTFSSIESYNATCSLCSICQHNTIVKTACNGKADVICIPYTKDIVLHVIAPVVATIVVLVLGGAFVLLILWRKGYLSICIDICHDQGLKEVKVPVNSYESHDNRYNFNRNNYFCEEMKPVSTPIDASDNAAVDNDDDDSRGIDCTKTSENKHWCDLFRQISIDITYEKWKNFMRTLYSHIYKTVEDVNNRIDEVCINYQQDGVKEQVYRCLCKWKAQRADNACLEDIIDGLVQNHMDTLADKLKSLYPSFLRNSQDNLDNAGPQD